MMINRRDLLKTGGAVVVGFAFDAVLARPAAALGLREGADAPAQQGGGTKPLDLSEVDSFLAFHADGSVTVYTSRVDVGTGLRVAIAQMAAEELGIPAQKITVLDGDTSLCPDQGATGGSTGLTRGGTEIRQAP